MKKIRRIKTASKSIPTLEGAGVRLKRAFGFQNLSGLDPFLLLDDFHSNNPEDYLKGFPWHPHRGIETITYMIQGRVEHGDSMGNKGIIKAGDVQWMTAGSGIIHQEMPLGAKDGRMWGLQLWANLPSVSKMMEPRYREVNSKTIPEITVYGGVKIKIICGEIEGVKGPVQDIVTNPGYYDITIPGSTEYSHKVKMGHTLFAYILEGSGYFDQNRDPYSCEKYWGSYFDYEATCLFSKETLVIYDDGDEAVITSGERGVRFLLVSGKPIGEPVAWQGPIVMNTREELRIAFEEYRNGTFIKYKG